MRITGGRSKGRVISAPDGQAVRPTASKIRQAFFNILGHKIVDARFLDLFAGSGIMGIEALSRGAKALVAVEESRRLTKAIEANLARFGYEAEVICGDVCKVLPVFDFERFDVVFADPPYQSRLALSVLAGVDRHKLLNQDGILAIEHSREMVLAEELSTLIAFGRRLYGQTAITFYKPKI